jgi:LysM repeat protein
VAPIPQPVDPEEGLVEAVPANAPVAIPVSGESDTRDEPGLIHTIVRGDTLTKLSITYKVPVSEIQRANQLGNDIVHVGQQLRIPGATLPAPTETPVPDVEPATEPATPAAVRHHTVVRGDTLSRIARKYSVDPKAIMRANGMKNDIVRLGARLVIPPADP